LELHAKDKDLVYKVKSFFCNVGKIYSKSTSVIYQIRTVNETIKVIIPHFEKYPLITQKQNDFILFKKIVKLINKNEHLNKEGLTEIIKLKAFLNKGLSKDLSTYFPDTIVIKNTDINIPNKIYYNWIAEFFSGEACFFIKIQNNHYVKLEVRITQHSRDRLLINKLKNFMECGYVNKHSKDAVVLVISNFKDIYEKIIPLFKKYRILGIKSLDFEDFCKVAEIKNNKNHLRSDGLNEIKKIKIGINRGRIFSK